PEARTASCADLQAELREVARRAGWRATTREVREAVAELVPEARARLEDALIRFRDVGVGAERPAGETTLVVHIATSGLDVLPGASDPTVVDRASARPWQAGFLSMSMAPLRPLAASSSAAQRWRRVSLFAAVLV